MTLLLLSRLRLAVIHYNANSVKEKERLMYISYPKYKKGEATVKTRNSRPASFGENDLSSLYLAVHFY